MPSAVPLLLHDGSALIFVVPHQLLVVADACALPLPSLVLFFACLPLRPINVFTLQLRAFVTTLAPSGGEQPLRLSFCSRALSADARCDRYRNRVGRLKV